MWDLFMFGSGVLVGGVVVADWLGFRLAKMGDPFWQGWTEVRTWGLWKADQ